MASRDYEEFNVAFSAHGVRHLVINAHPVTFHARPRTTKNLEILIERTCSRQTGSCRSCRTLARPENI
jgi:hypothetical protein